MSEITVNKIEKKKKRVKTRMPVYARESTGCSHDVYKHDCSQITHERAKGGGLPPRVAAS